MAIDHKNLPKHVALIMDGNGRWAHSLGMPRVFGHQKGADKVREVVEVAGEMGISYLTLYAFSTENWSRPQSEVSALFQLLAAYLKSEIKELCEKNVRLSSVGDRHLLPKECLELIEQGEEQTKGNTGLRLTLALSYGSRSDIVSSCKALARKVSLGQMSLDDINEQSISRHLSTCHLPDPDLLIRTSGEQRISNFLLYESAYTEFYFCPVHWPDFGKEHFEEAIEEYTRRSRRFGKLSQDISGQHQSENLGELC